MRWVVLCVAAELWEANMTFNFPSRYKKGSLNWLVFP